jgi:hypothetical protein
MSASEALFFAGCVPFAALGSAHVAMTLADLRRPRYFAPVDRDLIAPLAASGVATMAWVPGARSMWDAWQGANLTHGIGLLVFGGLLAAIAAHDFALVSEVPALRATSIAVAAAYFAIATRFWFAPPAILTGLGTACFAASALA